MWAWLFRRGEVMRAIAVAAVLSLVSAFVLEFQPYVAYATALLGAGRFAVPFAGNLGLTGVAPDLALPLGLLACCAYVLLLWRSHDESTVLMWSLLVGLVAAPYVALYGAPDCWSEPCIGAGPSEPRGGSGDRLAPVLDQPDGHDGRHDDRYLAGSVMASTNRPRHVRGPVRP